MCIQIDYEILKDGGAPTPNIHVYSEDGSCAFVSVDSSAVGRNPRQGHFRSTALIPGNLLNEGSYSVLAAISTMDPVRVHVAERDAVAFQIVEGEGSLTRVGYGGAMPGVIRPLLDWSTTELQIQPGEDSKLQQEPPRT